MLSVCFIRQFKLPRTRQFNSTPTVKENKSVSETPSSQPANKSSAKSNNVLGAPMHNVTNFDKRVLVWVKRYPNMDSVPGQVSQDCMMKANTKGRIKVCNYMIVFAICGFFVTAMSGKKEAAGGRHILSDRMKWYKEIEEKGRTEAAVAEAARKS